MVGLAAICWAMWSPTEIICSISSFVSYWAELQQQADKEMLEAGADALKTMALKLHPQQASPANTGMVLLH
ncbi:hypothetical protein HU200_002136 [Digitaria exilis]|uniref:Uncharacterized protein n=1 Tax=Digitaria exilis TaxID=1010633 RepID=A0A835FX76_9POAL|nr:hypothetical protein HU200_002136 [Digitaria exilis]